MAGQEPRWTPWLLVWSAWLLVAAPGICSSFSGVVLTDGGSPVAGAFVYWNNLPVCTPSRPIGTPSCSLPTVTGSTKTAPDGSFAALNLPADSYTVCASPPTGAYQLNSCAWPVTGSISSVKLAENEDRTGVQILLRSGSLVVITVKDPLNALLKSFLLCGAVVGTGGYYGAAYDPIRHAYTTLIPRGIPAHLNFDTLLVVQDGDGNSVPIDTAVLPFTMATEEVPLSVSVVPAVVNAASYLPGISQGMIASLFGRGFTDTPGIYLASGFPLPTQISGTSVKVNDVPAPLLAVAEQDGQGQINFQVPHLPYAQELVIVADHNGKEQTFYVRNFPDQFGVFGSLAHLSGDPVTEASPADPGEQVVMYWTGGYPSNFWQSGTAFLTDGVPTPASAVCANYLSPQVKIGGIVADATSCSPAPGTVGIGQVVVTVPSGLPSGDYDVELIMGGNLKGNIVRMAVRVP